MQQKITEALIGATGFPESRRMVAAISATGHKVKSFTTVFDPGIAKYNFFFLVESREPGTSPDGDKIIERFKELINLTKGIVPLPEKEEK